MEIWKKIAICGALAITGVTGVGYVTAFASLAACADRTFSDIQRQRIRGTDMSGNPVVLSRDHVLSRVAGPFLVESRYIVPYDMHGSYHFTRYIALPWGQYERSRTVIDLVIVPSHSRWLSANNSFKPTPLRGAA